MLDGPVCASTAKTYCAKPVRTATIKNRLTEFLYGIKASTLHNRGAQVVLFLRGFVRLPQNNTTIDCLVRDISEAGAKLRFRCTTPMPEFFELHIPSTGQIAKSKLIWNDNCEVGISFECLGALGPLSSSDGELSARMARLEDEITALKQTLRLLQKLVDQTKAA
jgi:hypothetical protein